MPDKAEPPAIRFKMETLHARSGVTRDVRHFACDIRAIAETQPLPEYGVQIEHRKGQRELVTLYRDEAKPCRPPRGRRLKKIRGERVEPAIDTDVYLVDKTPMVIEPTPEPAIENTEPGVSEPAEAAAGQISWSDFQIALDVSKPPTKEHAKELLGQVLQQLIELSGGKSRIVCTLPDGSRIHLEPDPNQPESPAHRDLKAALRQVRDNVGGAQLDDF